MAEYSKLARGSFISTNLPQTIPLPFIPQRIEVTNYTVQSQSVRGSIFRSIWDVSMPTDSALQEGLAFLESTYLVFSQYVSAGGIKTFSKALSNQFGPQQQVKTATTANPVVFTVDNHGYSVGDTVVFEGLYASSSSGMAQMCGMVFTVNSVPNSNTFQVNWNTNQSNYAGLSGSPFGAYVKQVYSDYLYQPGVYNIFSVSQSQQAVVTTTSYHNLVIGSQVTFRIPSLWGMIQLNGITGTVTAVNSSFSFTMNVDSTHFSTFNTNVPFMFVPGLNFPQVIAVGDINTGGGLQTINGIDVQNGPSINGSFLNNTSFGFIAGVPVVGAEGDLLFWEAKYYDLNF